jgi:hypothetical protein
MEKEKLSLGESGENERDVEKKEEMAELEIYWRSSYAGEKRTYERLCSKWRRDIKSLGYFMAKPKPPITAEERKERYLRRKCGEKVEEEVEEDVSDVSENDEWDCDNNYPSDYKSDEDAFSDGGAYRAEIDIDLELKPRKKRWLGLRRQKLREEAIKERKESC